MAALERQHREEEAHGAAARVAHQQGGGLGIHPQVGQQRADEDDGGGAVIPQFLAVSQQEGADADHRQAGRQAVHTVGAVDDIDAGPDEDDDEHEVERIRDGKAPLQKVHGGAVEVQVGHTRHNGDDEVDEAFFVFVPGHLGGIVKIAGEHGGDEQHGIDDILGAQRHHRQRDQRDAEHEDEAGAAGLAFGKLAVHRKRAAMVVGELFPKDRIHQRRQRKSQQKSQRVHGALTAR